MPKPQARTPRPQRAQLPRAGPQVRAARWQASSPLAALAERPQLAGLVRSGRRPARRQPARPVRQEPGRPSWPPERRAEWSPRVSPRQPGAPPPARSSSGRPSSSAAAAEASRHPASGGGWVTGGAVPSPHPPSTRPSLRRDHPAGGARARWRSAAPPPSRSHRPSSWCSSVPLVAQLVRHRHVDPHLAPRAAREAPPFHSPIEALT